MEASNRSQRMIVDQSSNWVCLVASLVAYCFAALTGYLTPNRENLARPFDRISFLADRQKVSNVSTNPENLLVVAPKDDRQHVENNPDIHDDEADLVEIIHGCFSITTFC